MKLFIDISSDKIGIYGAGENPIYLERNNVDREIGNILVSLDKKNNISEVLVLNGPGGFTNLRVGSLALNLLKTLKNNTIDFYTISKLELYHKFYENNRIFRYGFLYIGQKSNIRLCDIEKMEILNTVKKLDIQNINDQYGGNLFFDQVYDEGYFGNQTNKIAFNYGNDKLYLNSGNDKTFLTWDELATKKVEQIEANYMIDPNIS